jgi:glucose/arabinose dehydrogenase
MKETKMIKWVGAAVLAIALTACNSASTLRPANDKPADSQPAAQPTVAPAPSPTTETAPAAPSALDSPLTSPIAETFQFGTATVESVVLEIDKGAAGVIFARVKGALGDSCTSIASVDTRDEKGKVNIDVKTKRPADLICSQVVKTFEERIAINLLTKEAGDYVVNVNGMERQMSVDKDGNATVK